MPRRDKKNRNLRPGEYQSKSGRYEYRYIDVDGKKKSVYSWRLVDTDKTPPKKKETKTLRQLENEIAVNLEKGVHGNGAGLATLNDEFDKWYGKITSLPPEKQRLKPSTLVAYKNTYNQHVRGGLGCKKVKEVSRMDLVDFYLKKITDEKLDYARIKNIHNALSKCFIRCEDDREIRFNPCVGALDKLKELVYVEEKKHKALTKREQDIFAEELANPKYRLLRPIFVFMLGTGCRASEAIGLTWDDVDFENNTVSINHQAAYLNLDGEGSKCVVTPCKTKSAVREIPMIESVRLCLLDTRQKQKEQGIECDQVLHDITGKLAKKEYSGFVFLNKVRHVYSNSSLDECIKRIVKKYNQREAAAAAEENRDPELLPQFSCHTLRHTFITRFAECESNIKLIQDIAGHSDFHTTMNIYNEIQEELRKEKLGSLAPRIKIWH